MKDLKTRGIKNLERQMDTLDEGSIRYQVLLNAKTFKASWIGLGQTLYSVWKDKLYKEWGYEEFDTYTSREIGLRKLTALKLLRSYSFLEKEEPDYLKNNRQEPSETVKTPTLESVDVLRRANTNKDIDQEDYARIKKYVLEDGKDAREVRKDLADIVKKRREEDPDFHTDKRRMVLKRFLGTLRSVRKEASSLKLLSPQLLQKTDDIIATIEEQCE